MIWKFGERLEELELERYKSWQKKTFFERDIQYILYSHWSNRLDELAEKLDKKLNCLSFNSLYLHWFDLICLNQKLEDKRGGGGWVWVWDFFFLHWLNLILQNNLNYKFRFDLILFWQPQRDIFTIQKGSKGWKAFFCMYVCLFPSPFLLLVIIVGSKVLFFISNTRWRKKNFFFLFSLFRKFWFLFFQPTNNSI